MKPLLYRAAAERFAPPGHPVCKRRCVREASGKRRTSATGLTSVFTLIELLVVTAIIATLAAILFPVFAQVREPERAGTWAASQPRFTLDTITLAQIHAPADKILVVEKGVLAYTDASQTVAYASIPASGTGSVGPVNGQATIASAHNELQYDFDCSVTSTAGNCATWGTSPGNMPRFRHTKTCNSLFMDGHVMAVVRGRMDWFKNICVNRPYGVLYGAANGPY